MLELLEGGEGGVVLGVVQGVVGGEVAGVSFAEADAVAGDGAEAGLVDEGPEFGSAAVDELGAELDG